MTRAFPAATLIALALLGCSKDAKLPPKAYEAALARTASLPEGQDAAISGFQRSFYGSAKHERYYCVDLVAKKSRNDLILVTVYDDTTGTFRPVEGGRLGSGLTLEIDGEVLTPQKTFVWLAVQQPPQPNEPKR
jgi:hypothetical protein